MVDRSRPARLRTSVAVLACAGLLALLALQTWAYATRLTLSLGPRVILQPWLLRQGFVMYRDIADLHTPLMPLTLAALIPLVPDGLALAKLALIVLMSLTAGLTFVAGWRTVGPMGGLGYGKLWHESFLAPLYLVLFLCYDASTAGRSAGATLLAGFTGGIAVLYKQQAILAMAVFSLWSGWTHWRAHRSARRLLREMALMGAAFLLPIVAVGLYQLILAGSLESAAYWTLGYNMTSDYASLAALPPTIRQMRVILLSGLLMPAAFAVCVHSWRKGSATWLTLGLALLLLGASSAGLYPRYAAFHLQPALPWVALATTITWAYVWRLQRVGRPLALALAAAVCVVLPITAEPSLRLVAAAPAQQTIDEYSNLVPLAQQVRQAIGPTGCAYIFPDDEASANLYYLLDCPPPGFWVFHYPWNWLDPIRSQISSSLQSDAPAWIVYFPGRHGVGQTAPEIVAYLEAHYRREVRLEWRGVEVWLLTWKATASARTRAGSTWR
jgi:hypothetical protein